MSLLSGFLASHLIPALEEAFIANEPAVQAGILNEIESFVGQVGTWLLNKKIASAVEAPAIPDNAPPAA